MRRRSLLFALLAAAPAVAQPKDPDPPALSLDRIFASPAFHGDRVPGVKWLDAGAYTTLEPSKSHKGSSDLVRYDAAGKAEVLVPAEKLIPPDAKEPLAVQGYELSKDLDLVLIFTNSVQVWRQQHARRLLDLSAARRASSPSSAATPSRRRLMFAKLSPDGRARRVRPRQQPLRRSRPPAARRSSSRADGTRAGHQRHVRLGLRGGVLLPRRLALESRRQARSPTGNSTSAASRRSRSSTTRPRPTPSLKTFAYPKTGERNSACRVGVVAAAGGATKWLDVPGDTRTDFYIPRMEWAGNPHELVLQRVNRLQNAVDVMLADAATGKVADGPHGARRGVGGRPRRRRRVGREGQRLHLDQRTRRLAAPVRRLPRRRHRPPRYERRVRRHPRRPRRRKGRAGVLLRVAGQPDAAIPVSRGPERQRHRPSG